MCICMYSVFTSIVNISCDVHDVYVMCLQRVALCTSTVMYVICVHDVCTEISVVYVDSDVHDVS